MAKRESTGPKRKATDADGDEIEETGAAPKAATKMITARVRPGNTVIVGEVDSDGNAVEKVVRAGGTCSVSEDELKARPWAFETGERRARSGQNTRLQNRVKELESEIERLKAAGKVKAGKPDPNRESAVESIMARGDNYSGRNEPQIGSVPADVVEAFETGRDIDALSGGGLSLDDETGMKGIGRESSGSSELRQPSITSPGAQASQPFEGEPGQSQRPGTGEPSGDPQS